MKKSDVFSSEFYNSGDVKDRPILLTISDVRIEPVGNGTNTSDKLVAYFQEANSKKLVVTSTKFDAIAMIAKSDDTENWAGVQIVLELGKANYQGKLVDAIAIRAPRRPNKSVVKPTAPITRLPTNESDLDDEVPY
jgi:hypothetical protein